ncbi:hypothetical protein Taro_052776 [Colocasia esculenta]|uniref:Cupin type-1 domain-containing protein n=1 Tax=Colocasia esculenta TaxID=4460 RepID=A0A843XK92_COLES|nr:hypothetical protein [Colocasia esculenta]
MIQRSAGLQHWDHADELVDLSSTAQKDQIELLMQNQEFLHLTDPFVSSPCNALSSQNPGVITIANAVFGSKPPISDYVLAKAFQVDKKVIDYLQSQFWMDNN